MQCAYSYHATGVVLVCATERKESGSKEREFTLPCLTDVLLHFIDSSLYSLRPGVRFYRCMQGHSDTFTV